MKFYSAATRDGNWFVRYTEGYFTEEEANEIAKLLNELPENERKYQERVKNLEADKANRDERIRLLEESNDHKATLLKQQTIGIKSLEDKLDKLKVKAYDDVGKRVDIQVDTLRSITPAELNEFITLKRLCLAYRYMHKVCGFDVRLNAAAEECYNVLLDFIDKLER